jgi:hypothetical protein
MLAVVVTQAGCSRAWFRNDADQETYHLIQEKSTDPRWTPQVRAVEMDPRSRFFDPTDPDFSPMPPDDPFSHEYLHCVNGMKGAKEWIKYGMRSEVENPHWREHLTEFLELTPDERYVLTLSGAVQIAYLNSPTYQSQVEEVYLTGLDLAFERFRFDCQFFGGFNCLFPHAGRLADFGVFGEEGAAIPIAATGYDSNPVGFGTGFSVQRLFPTGAEIGVGFFNSFLWQFAGPNTENSISFLNFSVFQPLLRLGGREVVLERLTRVERGLLANLRALAYYRQSFFVQTAIGDEARGGPQRAGGFLGGAGLDAGFTGTGVGGFGGVGGITGFGRMGGIGGLSTTDGSGSGFVGGGAGLAGGFVGLVQLQQELKNREANVVQILRELARMEANFKAGRIDAFQVDQFRQSVQAQLSLLLQARNQFESSIDAYLISLGLPPDLPVTIDGGLLKPFEFFDAGLGATERAAVDFATKLRQPAAANDAYDKLWEEAQRLQHSAVQHLAIVKEDFARFDACLPKRLAGLPRAQDQQLLVEEMKTTRTSFQRLEREIGQNGESLSRLKPPAGGAGALPALEKLLDALVEQLAGLSLVQARVRAESIVVNPVELTPEEAFQIARDHRLDWMNQRAALVDQWRLIGFNANRLQSDLNIILTGDVGTDPDDPLNFNQHTGHLSAGVQFDPPLTRKAERNQYREAQINFQALRRSYIQYEDGVKQTLRLDLRTLVQARENLELQRQSFLIALRAYHLCRLRLRQPPPMAEAGQPVAAGAQFGPTTARDLLGAISDLLGAHNNFMSVWIQYESARLLLYRDLGILKLDDHGMWMEEPLEPYRQALWGVAPPECQRIPTAEPSDLPAELLPAPTPKP